MCVIGLCLQSLVLILIDVRAAVHDDVEWAKQTLKNLADDFSSPVNYGEGKAEDY